MVVCSVKVGAARVEIIVVGCVNVSAAGIEIVVIRSVNVSAGGMDSTVCVSGRGVKVTAGGTTV